MDEATVRAFAEKPLSFIWQGTRPIALCAETGGMIGSVQPTLELADIQRLAADWLAMRALIADIAWIDERNGKPACPACYETQHHGHAPDCRLDAVLKEGR